jgi:hypothetical protein
MEDVLEVYQRPYDPTRPQINLDEASKQLLSEVRAPLPIQPGQPERVDNEYTREGTAALFMVCEPLAGRRHVFVRAQRTRLDFAAVIKTLCDELYPAAKKIVLVMDQLNTHGVASLYAAFPPAEALRLAQRLEIHHTPKHGSWLKHGRDRTLGSGPPMLGRAHGKPGKARPCRGRLGAPTQHRCRTRGLALYHRRCPHQTQTPLPINIIMTDH